MCVNVIFLCHRLFLTRVLLFLKFHSVALFLNNFYCYRKWIKFINADGTNKILAKGNDCLVRTNRCFSKDPSDVVAHVRTRLMIKKSLVFLEGPSTNILKKKLAALIRSYFEKKNMLTSTFVVFF